MPVADEVSDPFDELPPQALRSVAPSGSAEAAARRSSIWRRFIVVFHVLMLHPRFLVASLELLPAGLISRFSRCTSVL